jgi:hypothetical protein
VLRPLGAGAGLLVLVVSKWAMWWGGACWGPRLLADALPVLVLLMAPATRWLTRSRALAVTFGLLAVLSVTAHALGAFRYDGRWDSLGGADPSPSRFWSWADGPLAFYGRPVLGEISRRIGIARVPTETSGSAPRLLVAAYRVSGPQASALPRERLALSITVTNTGRATWLAEAPGDRGSVRLGWRWWHDTVLVGEGRAPLWHDVPPGASVEVVPDIRAPDVPGRYTLILDMVSEGVTWFEQQGHAPERLAVVIDPLDVTRVLDRPARPDGHVPKATVATDRESYVAGERLLLTVGVDNPRMRGVDAYLILEGPGVAWSFDGQTLVRSAGTWRPWLRGLPVPARLQGRYALALPRMPPGAYSWHAVITEPGSYRPIAAARARLRVRAGP